MMKNSVAVEERECDVALGTGGHFKNCVSEHGTPLAVCRSIDGEQTHRSWSYTQFTEFSSRTHPWT